MAVESEGVWRWLWTTLRASTSVVADVGARIYEREAPPDFDGTYPIVVCSLAGGSDSQGFGRKRTMSEQIWLVKVIDRDDDPGRASAIADHVDAALQGQSGSTSGGADNVYPVRRLSPVRLGPERVGEDRYWHVGGNYRIQARATT